MDKTTKKNSKEEIVPIRRSIHVVYLSCPHCGEEMDDVRLCPECGEPMKVIDVVEKFGDDADRFLERAKKRLEKSTKENKQENNEEDDDFVAIDKEEPNIILMGGDDTIDEGINPDEEVGDNSLDVIFPGDEEESSDYKEKPQADDDLTKALEQLDSEEDENVTAEDFGFEDGDIPEL